MRADLSVRDRNWCLRSIRRLHRRLYPTIGWNAQETVTGTDTILWIGCGAGVHRLASAGRNASEKGYVRVTTPAATTRTDRSPRTPPTAPWSMGAIPRASI